MDDLNPLPAMRGLLLAVVFAPLAFAVIVRLSGGAARRTAAALAFLHLGVTALLTVGAYQTLIARTDMLVDGRPVEVSFSAFAVPGDPGVPGDGNGGTGETAWTVFAVTPGMPGTPPPAVQLFLGLDGLNVWLIALTSLMTLVGVWVSWASVTDRPGTFYAWLFVLQTGATGAFAALDVILFYAFFELTLIPSFFLIGFWGVGPSRRDAAKRFFLYTLLGSLFTLVGLIGVVLLNPTPVSDTPVGLVDGKPAGDNTRYVPTYDAAGQITGPKAGPVTFSIPRLVRNVSTWSDMTVLKAYRATPEKKAAATAERERYVRLQAWLLVALMAGFAVKTPLIPFHTWQPSAYAEAPAGVALILSAVLAKLGTYGMIRVVLPLVPDAVAAHGMAVFGTLAAVGIVYAGFCAFAQRDLKKLAAYSSISHLGFLVLGLFAGNAAGLAGATLHMLNHGLTAGALFALLGFLADRYRTTDANQFGGLLGRFPAYGFFMIVICLAAVGLPGLNSFVSEMLLMAAVFDPEVVSRFGYWFAAAAAAGLFLSAWYTMTMLRKVFFGPVQEPATAAPAGDVTGREWLAYGLPAVLCVLLGLFPQTVLDTVKADAALLTRINNDARRRADFSYVPAAAVKPPPVQR